MLLSTDQDQGRSGLCRFQINKSYTWWSICDEWLISRSDVQLSRPDQ